MIEYAVYRGDEFLDIGTAQHCADLLGVSRKQFHVYHTPSYYKRLEERPSENAIVAVKLGRYEE